MFKAIANIPRRSGYWFLVFLFTLSLELIALYFQYQLGYGPCVLCVQIRAVVGAVLVLSLLGMLCCKSRLMANLTNLLTLAASVVFYLKSKELLQIERNEIESSCGFSADFPSWLALDKWLPSIFEPWEACGYTPMMWFDYTMAEALLAASYAAMGICVLLLIFNLLFGKPRRQNWFSE